MRKLGIAALNPMQEATLHAIHAGSEVVLLSPTGTGKTLAFLLPLVAELNPAIAEVQALIVVPSRELAIQLEQVAREMGSGYKATAVYGGRSGTRERMELEHRPAILIGTPGRLADHIRREAFSLEAINTLVLDEFDKSLEIGFENEMRELVEALPEGTKKVLTSATEGVAIPAFVGLRNPTRLSYLEQGSSKLAIKSLPSPSKDKLHTLVEALAQLAHRPGIVFCNFKDSIQRVSQFLSDHRVAHGCFHGGMEQQDRERTLIQFRNGTHRILVATDLAARGLDIPELGFIIHYHLPLKEHEFTHRNGRTARMHSCLLYTSDAADD